MKQIGRYKIIRELGRGGMAIVYRAYDAKFERAVAIKVIAAHSLHNQESRKRFEREAKVIAALAHPAIVPVHDFGEDHEQPYLVMSLMRGGSLNDHLRQGVSSLHDAARLMLRLAPALDLAHTEGVVHRDLKPDNILFDQLNNPYITDFGIAKLFNSTTELSQSGVVMGTAAYMSPEQATGKDLDGRSDIYALGVILFQILTGRRPFESNNSLGFVYQHINEPVPNICNIRPDLPAGCEAIIARAMAKDPNDRYATASEFAAALTSVIADLPPDIVSDSQLKLGSQPITAQSVITKMMTPSWWRKHRVRASALFIAVALGMAVALAVIISNPSLTDSDLVDPPTELLYRVINVQEHDLLSIRAEPKIDSAVIGKIPSDGSHVQITGASFKTDEGIWVPIQYKGISGWVNRYFLSEQSLLYRIVNIAEDDLLNIRAAPGAKQPIRGEIPPDGTDLQITGSTVDADGTVWVPIKYMQISGWVNRSFLIKQSWLFRIAHVEEADVLNIRSEPGPDNPVLGEIPSNAMTVQIIGTSVMIDEAIWVPIKYGPSTGWVNRYFLSEQ